LYRVGRTPTLAPLLNEKDKMPGKRVAGPKVRLAAKVSSNRRSGSDPGLC
jgi:hypothetical protein